jgi:NADPH-dependent glutamate synthase beta subunit-like oxidoreductase
MERHRGTVRYFGNLHVNGCISLERLRDYYARDAGLFLCTGAQGGDRKLGISGEERHMTSARAFVAWYNGHPDYCGESFLPRGTGEVIIVGNGNVALDVARMVLHRAATLRRTDCNPAAVEAIDAFGAHTVHIVGRRDAANASWTARELRELVTLAPDLDIVVHEAMRWAPAVPGTKPASLSRSQKRALEILKHHARYADMGAMAGPIRAMAPRSIHFWFGLTPQSLECGADGRVHLCCAPNELFYTLDGQVQSRPLPHERPVRLSASIGAAFRSIGYTVAAPSGLPFDATKNCVPNNAGRVAGLSDAVYVAGWLKHGPRGVIANSLSDAQETVDQFVADLQWRHQSAPTCEHSSSACQPDLKTLLERSKLAFVDWDGWLRIEAEEHRGDAVCDRPQRKILTRTEMLRIALDAEARKSGNQSF